MNTNQFKIRSAGNSDVEQILEIYSPFITDSAVSFEIEVPTLADFSERFREITRSYPWLVAVADSVVVGYAYGCSHRSRAAYRFSVETSVYVAAGFQRRGVGRELYEELLQELTRRGFKHAYAGITLPNPSSEALHTSFGFNSIGVFPSVGFKFDQWQDVAWYHKPLSA